MQGVIGHATVLALKIGARKSARIDDFLASAPAFALGVWANVGLGTKAMQFQTRLAMRTLTRGLRFPAARVVLLPSDHKLFNPTL